MGFEINTLLLTRQASGSFFLEVVVLFLLPLCSGWFYFRQQTRGWYSYRAKCAQNMMIKTLSIENIEMEGIDMC